MAIETDFLGTLNAGAGLDSKRLADALVNAERVPRESVLNAKIETSDTRISAHGVVLSSLQSLGAAFGQLNTVGDLNQLTVSTGGSSAVTGTANTFADVGSYRLSVSQLARPQVTTSNGFASTSQAINGGDPFDLTVTTATGDQVVSVTQATPEGVVAALQSAGLGISASIVNTGAANNPYVIKLTGQSGSNESFAVTSPVGDLDLSAIDQTAQDASFTLDGVAMTRSSNTVTDAISGVTINLNAATGADVNLTVSRDTAGVETAIRTLVATYNDVDLIFDGLGGETSDDDELAGAFQFDSGFRQLRRQMTDLITGLSSSPQGNIRYLSDLGVSIQQNGSLVVDDAKLASVLENNFDDVTEFFTAGQTIDSTRLNASNGFAGDAFARLNDMTRSTGLVQRSIAFERNQVSDFEEDLEQLEARMDALYTQYIEQFSVMDSTVQLFNQLQESLKSQFDNLPYSSNNN